MNYKNWKENNLAPTKLTLDKLNHRLPDMGKNPFGHSARRIGDFYAGLVGDFINSSSWKKLRAKKNKKCRENFSVLVCRSPATKCGINSAEASGNAPHYYSGFSLKKVPSINSGQVGFRSAFGSQETLTKNRQRGVFLIKLKYET